MTTTVRDYDLAETSKLVRIHLPFLLTALDCVNPLGKWYTDQRSVHFRRDDGLPPYIPQVLSTTLRASHHGLQVLIRSQDRQDPRSWSEC